MKRIKVLHILRIKVVQSTAFLLFLISINSCKKYVEVDSLSDQLLASQVFASATTANTAIAGMYRSLRDNIFGAAGYGPTLLTGLSSDELLNFFPNQTLDDYRNNSIQVTNPALPWGNFYNIIYQTNEAIDNLQSNPSLPPAAKNQFLGESKFIRAFCYFYLANFFGDVPLLTTSNVVITQSAGRASIEKVYDQIISDLRDAETLLPNDYSVYDGEHTRANRLVAIAFLARVYLFNRNWAGADSAATSVLESGKYNLLDDIDSFAVQNNAESILQWSNNSSDLVYEPSYFIFTMNPYVICSDFLLNAFENGDQRKIKWINSGLYSGNTYFYPYKYKSLTHGNEYYTVLRLAEQYLIRAEARANEDDITNAVSDLNIIRQRAGLPSISATISVDSCINAILHERQVELFAETGHRWFDLKRIGKVNEVLGAEKPNVWKPTAVNYPIPLSDIQKDQNLTQNAGY
jgi:hypothetical protein